MTYPLYCLGVGPGDPELITVKALRLLQQAEIVAYPLSREGDSFARSIVHPHLKSDQHTLPIHLDRPQGYAQAARALSEFLAQGLRVVVLCEGDPFFYGSFGRLIPFLSPEISVEVIPGVTSVSLGCSILKRPLVLGNDRVTFLPALLSFQRLKQSLETTDNAVILKLGHHFKKAYQALDELGLIESASYIEHAGLPSQKILPLKEVQVHSVPYFSFILVHRPERARL